MLHESYIDSAPTGPFDGAACLLTLHFLPPDERLQTLKRILLRLKPGAPLVVAHHSFPSGDSAGDRWLARKSTFSTAHSPSRAGLPIGREQPS